MIIPDPPAPCDTVVSVAAFVTCVVIVVGMWSCWWRGETSHVPLVVAVVSKIRTRISCNTKDATVLDDNGDTATYDDPYDSISKCPNPNCIRCQRYEELFHAARRRLPWILQDTVARHQQQKNKKTKNKKKKKRDNSSSENENMPRSRRHPQHPEPHNTTKSSSSSSSTSYDNNESHYDDDDDDDDDDILTIINNIKVAIEKGPTIAFDERRRLFIQQQQQQRQCHDRDSHVTNDDNDEEEEDDGNSSRTTAATVSVAPVIGQYPTVFLLRGLHAEPIVTQMHESPRGGACSLFRKGGHTLRQLLLQEYISTLPSISSCPQQPPRVGRGPAATQASTTSTIAPSSWLENDVAASSSPEEGTTKKDTGQASSSSSSSSSSWRVLHLMNQGSWIPHNCTQCPRTTDVIMSLQNHMEGCIFGNAFISVLTPGTVIEPHCGPTNVRHRFHCPLQLPSTSSSSSSPVLTITTTKQTWEEGRCFVFDDSLTHSVNYENTNDNMQTAPGLTTTTTTTTTTTAATAMHRSSVIHQDPDKENAMHDDGRQHLRVVLIVDLWHPDLSRLERTMIKDLFPAV